MIRTFKLGVLFALATLVGAAGLAQTTTTYTGVIKDLAQNPVTSGQVTFTLAPPSDSTVPGTGRFTPTTVPCNINADGTLSGFVAGVVSGACKVTMNTALSPGGTSYRICIQPQFITPGSCFYDYAVTSTKDISTVSPTLATGPTNFFDAPAGAPGAPGTPPLFRGAWAIGTTYATGDAVSYSDGSSYVSLVGGNIGNVPQFSPLVWGVLAKAGTGPLGIALEHVFTVAGTFNFAHNLNTLNPLTTCYVNSGATAYSTAPADANDIAVTVPAAADITCAFGYIPTVGTFTPGPPNITLQPVNQTVLAGDPVTFSSAVTGAPPSTVQWNLSTNSGATYTPIVGATSTSYLFSASSGQNGNLYRAVFTNTFGMATSNAALLTVVLPATARWPMTEGSGSTFVDSVAGNNMAVAGSPGWGTWIIPSTYLFNGGTGADAFTNTNPASLVNGSPWSIKFWGVAATMPSSGQGTFLSNTDITSANPGIEVFITGGSTEISVALIGASGGVMQVNTVGAGILANARNLIAVTYDGSGNASGMKIYLNNAQATTAVASNTLSTQSITPSRPFMVMATPFPGGTSNYLAGVMDHLEVDPYVMTLGQVQTFFANGN